jgi:hypothetical protein
MKLTKAITMLAGVVVLAVLSVESSYARPSQETKGSLTVTVRDPAGAAIAGAEIAATRVPCKCKDCPPEEQPCKCCFQQITTDDAGQATLTLATGTYSVEIHASGFKTVKKEDVQVRSGQSQSLQITLDVGKLGRLVRLTGTIRNEEQQPLANVEVLFGKKGCKCDSCSEDQKPCKCCFSQRAVSDAAGNFSTIEMPEDKYNVLLLKDGKIAGSFNGLPVAKSEKLVFTIMPVKKN